MVTIEFDTNENNYRLTTYGEIYNKGESASFDSPGADSYWEYDYNLEIADENTGEYSAIPWNAITIPDSVAAQIDKALTDERNSY